MIDSPVKTKENLLSKYTQNDEVSLFNNKIIYKNFNKFSILYFIQKRRNLINN